MYQFYRFSLFIKYPFFLDYCLCHFELVEFLKLLLVIMAFFHIVVVKERCRKQNKSLLGCVMGVLYPFNLLNRIDSMKQSLLFSHFVGYFYFFTIHFSVLF